MAEHQLPKLNTRVRFPSSAPHLSSANAVRTVRLPASVSRGCRNPAEGVPMIYRRLVWVLVALAVAVIVPVQAHAEPPVKCLTNTQKGKQVYVPCDLLNAGGNFPPGQRCPPPLDQYPKDVADWCGEGPGLASPTPTTPTTPTSPTTPTTPTSPTTPKTPTSPTSPGTRS
jgi:hypothetical protein